MQMNFEVLGNRAAPDSCQHVEVTQTKEAVESAGHFSFPTWCVARQLSRWDYHVKAAHSGLPHLSVWCIRWYFWLFALSCRGTANRCLHLAGLRGQIQRKKLQAATSNSTFHPGSGAMKPSAASEHSLFYYFFQRMFVGWTAAESTYTNTRST